MNPSDPEEYHALTHEGALLHYYLCPNFVWNKFVLHLQDVSVSKAVHVKKKTKLSYTGAEVFHPAQKHEHKTCL